MLITVIKILCAVTYAAAALLTGRFFIHMFQLNSYKPKVHIKWMFKNRRGYTDLTCCSCALMAMLSAVLGDSFPQPLMLLYPVILLIFALSNLPKKQYKIPLKYTARIKRLIVTCAVIMLVPIILLFTSLPALAAFDMTLLFLLLEPWLILLANLINRPVELAINRHYIDDAKRILASCPNLTVIGITGSFGKTSVKYFLDSLLSVKYNVLKTPGNFNTPLGVVKTVRGSLRATHDIFLCEMGAKNVGDIKEICDIVHPKHGIITSVGPMHIESFKTIENVQKTKFELADALPSDGMLFLNFDCDIIRDANHPHPAVHYGIDDHSGYYVSGLKISEKGSEFRVTAPSGESCDYKTPLIGRHNVLNICGAIAVANSLRISLEELRPAVRRLESVPHRLQLINRGDYTVIDDAYNSNPSGAKAALETLSMAEGMKILVTPGMIELGGMEYELNREFGEEAAAVCDYVALVGEKQTKPIADGLLSAGYPENKLFVAQSLDEAMKKVYSIESGGRRKIILLENDLPDNY